MKNKTLFGDVAFEAIKGRTILKVQKSDRSLEIYFVDKSFINIELSSSGGCSCRPGDDSYCYCSSLEIEMSPYFDVAKD